MVTFIVRIVRVDVGAEMSNRSELRFEKPVGRRAVRTYIVYLEPAQIPTHIPARRGALAIAHAPGVRCPIDAGETNSVFI